MDAIGVGGRHFSVRNPVFWGCANGNELMDSGRFASFKDGAKAAVVAEAEEMAMAVD